MANPITAPNLQRFALTEIQFHRDKSGIIDVIDDLVERVMSAHARKACPDGLELAAPDDLTTLLSLHANYDSPAIDGAAA